MKALVLNPVPVKVILSFGQPLDADIAIDPEFGVPVQDDAQAIVRSNPGYCTLTSDVNLTVNAPEILDAVKIPIDSDPLP